MDPLIAGVHGLMLHGWAWSARQNSRLIWRDDRDLHLVLKEACDQVGTPRLVIVPNAIGAELRQTPRPPFQLYVPRKGTNGQNILEQGFIGWYLKTAPVVSLPASAECTFGVVSSEGNPAGVQRDGSNCFLVDFRPRPRSCYELIGSDWV